MLAIDVEKRRWWIVDVAGGNVMPRVESKLIIIGDQLFIFGGRNEEYFEDVDEANVDGDHWLNSYSIATLRNSQWIWDAHDVPLPPGVQAIGVCNAAAAIQDARSFVVFDIVLRTFFTEAEGKGTFPGDASWHDLYAHPGGLKKKDPNPSAVICNFYKDPAQHPELFIYSLPPQPRCRPLALRQHIAATNGIVFELFIVVGSKLFLLGWTKDKWDEWDILAEIPQQWI
ncbi:hypothetical protein B0H19DRAFT_1366899 [Mycena capillaripes]|nr:hypothetical protein B0H19DRAFT_1366899 [Mycena capillaripes]